MPSSGLAWVLLEKGGNHRITAPWDSELVFFCFCSFYRLLAHFGQCYISGEQTTSRKKLSFQMVVFHFDFSFFTFFLGNTNFGLDGEFLALLCGFKQVAICSSQADGLTI